ncbi:oocyte-secreted protein 3-like [Mastomys coucha]|uniref:oocyte-secreted protein 3-like n=1 Tax=Mastomys coucha TaxID=35658 RepID=UPI0012615113|nr:oocyte-secreted protein 3-like [Mastomys coucha]
MKAFIASGLLLLIFGMWRCSGIEPVSMECDYFTIRVIAKRALFYPDEFIDSDELFLGAGCPVTSVRPHELEFYYKIDFCGTFIEILFDGTIVNTWLTYMPKNISISAELQLQCVIPRLRQGKLGSKQLPEECRLRSGTYDAANTECHPPPQYWFLVLKRYCKICGQIHFPDDWSKPFHGWRNESFQRVFHPLLHR